MNAHDLEAAFRRCLSNHNPNPHPMPTTNTTTLTLRRRRLEAILETMNRLHCHRRVRGRATAWLLPRCRRLSAAYLEARHEELCAG